MRYYLPPQVFFCSTGSYCVFLDVDRDQYLAVDSKSVDALTREFTDCAAVSMHVAPSIADDLRAQGLLTLDGRHAKPFDSVTVPVPVPIPTREQSPLINFLRLPAFYTACRVANRRLTKAPIRDTLDFVRHRKSQPSRRNLVALEFLFSLISTFNALRLLYPRPYLCLFDSLALVEFLATYGIFPTWIFGVEGEPFQAHCWVQYGELLLNDNVPRVSKYTPIMSV